MERVGETDGSWCLVLRTDDLEDDELRRLRAAIKRLGGEYDGYGSG